MAEKVITLKKQILVVISTSITTTTITICDGDSSSRLKVETFFL